MPLKADCLEGDEETGKSYASVFAKNVHRGSNGNRNRGMHSGASRPSGCERRSLGWGGHGHWGGGHWGGGHWGGGHWGGGYWGWPGFGWGYGGYYPYAGECYIERHWVTNRHGHRVLRRFYVCD